MQNISPLSGVFGPQERESKGSPPPKPTVAGSDLARARIAKPDEGKQSGASPVSMRHREPPLWIRGVADLVERIIAAPDDRESHRKVIRAAFASLSLGPGPTLEQSFGALLDVLPVGHPHVTSIVVEAACTPVAKHRMTPACYRQLAQMIAGLPDEPTAAAACIGLRQAVRANCGDEHLRACKESLVQHLATAEEGDCTLAVRCAMLKGLLPDAQAQVQRYRKILDQKSVPAREALLALLPSVSSPLPVSDASPS